MPHVHEATDKRNKKQLIRHDRTYTSHLNSRLIARRKAKMMICKAQETEQGKVGVDSYVSRREYNFAAS